MDEVRLTENGWLRGLTPRTAVGLLPKASPRQRRLFACACVRLCWDHLTNPACRRAVEVAEAFCDGGTRKAELRAAHRVTWKALTELQAAWHPDPPTLALAAATYACIPQLHWGAGQPFNGVVECLTSAATTDMAERPAAMKRAHQAVRTLMHDVFGNPFRPVAFDPRWRTADTVGLARAIYEDRAFVRMPLLRDALMDAGCADEQVLNHTRKRTHVRGCWLLDRILDKK
jgi:hypothetical protein